MMPSMFILMVIFIIQKLFWIWFSPQNENQQKIMKFLTHQYTMINKMTRSKGPLMAMSAKWNFDDRTFLVGPDIIVNQSFWPDKGTYPCSAFAEGGHIDAGDGCWRPNILVTSLRCWWPILDIGDRFNRLGKSPTKRKKSLTKWFYQIGKIINISNQSPSLRLSHQHNHVTNITVIPKALRHWHP